MGKLIDLNGQPIGGDGSQPYRLPGGDIVHGTAGPIGNMRQGVLFLVTTDEVERDGEMHPLVGFAGLTPLDVELVSTTNPERGDMPWTFLTARGRPHAETGENNFTFPADAVRSFCDFLRQNGCVLPDGYPTLQADPAVFDLAAEDTVPDDLSGLDEAADDGD